MIEFALTLVFVIGILAIVAHDRHRKGLTSTALWIPIIWLFIVGSRPLSLWLNIQVPGGSVDAQLEGSPFDRDIFTTLIVGALIVLRRRGRTVGTLLRANWPFIIFLFYCGLSILWSDFPDVAFKRVIRLLGDIAMVLVVLTDPCPSAGVKGLLGRLGYIVIPLSVLADLGRGYVGLGYNFGLTRDKNMFGAISMVLGLGALWRSAILWGRERRHRVGRLSAHGSIAAMAMWCLWTAKSTTSTACFLIGSIIIAMRRWLLARNPAVLHLVMATLVLLPFYAAVINPDVGIVEAMGKDPTLTGRTEVWQAVLPMTPSPLFGAGFESFWLGSRLKTLWTIFVWKPNEAHNGYIEVYLNLGWTGIFLLAVVMVIGYRKIVSEFRRGLDTGSLRLAYFLVAVVYNFSEAGFRIFTPVWFFFLLAILADFTLESQDANS